MIRLTIVIDVPTNVMKDAVDAVDEKILTEETGTLWDDAEYEIVRAEILE